MLEVSEQGYYQWRKVKREEKVVRKERLQGLIRRLFYQHRRRYGSPRLARELRKHQEICSENRTAVLMQEMGLRAKGARKYRVTTISSVSKRVAPNLLARQFQVHAANQVWCGDITYLWTDEGFMYLAVFLDLFSRKVVGWALGNRITTALVLQAFHQARLIRVPPAGLLVHTDRGSQYTSDQFTALAAEDRLNLSMSRKGNCWDNAVVESFFASLKRELIEGERIRSREQLQRMVTDYIDTYYNTIRMHSTLDYLSPLEYEQKAAQSLRQDSQFPINTTASGGLLNAPA